MSEVEALQSRIVCISQPEDVSRTEFIGESVNGIKQEGTEPKAAHPLVYEQIL